MTTINERLTLALKKAWVTEEDAIEKYNAKCREHTEIVGQLSKKMSKVMKRNERMAAKLAELGYPQYEEFDY
jgi:2-polyprenyl-6-methoxyphenol hydroxylase-like FAD-dependent oxidoreductase